jgi:hypothetical protein
MTHRFPLALLLLLGVCACAHNPRPESPEQRAERQAQSLQEQQDAQAGSRSAGYTARTEDEGSQQATTESQPQAQPERPARTRVRQPAAAVRGTAGSMTAPVSTGVYGVTGGLLR